MYFRKYCFIVVLLGFLIPVQGQTIIFPGINGQELLDSLVANYKTSTTLELYQTKDTMYAVIYNHNDSLSCVYTGFTMYINPALDPSQAAFNNGNGINQEHTWPRSKGAGSGNAERDMHHLFPTRVDVNAARGSKKFDEIPDQSTDSWWWMDISTPTIPTQFIDQYSELDDFGAGRFETREDHKGNVARCMFYFYTMYKSEADAADPNFFNNQKNALRQWNSLDPVDAIELSRTNQIASYQGNIPNPFVIDTSLIGRAYFGVTTGFSASSNPQQIQSISLYQNYPNPFNPETSISFDLLTKTYLEINIFDISGRKVRTLISDTYSAGSHTIVWNGENDQGSFVTSGIYFYKLNSKNFSQTKKMFFIQ